MSKASKEVTNLTERKNLGTHLFGVKKFITLSVCLSVPNFDPFYLRTGRTEWEILAIYYIPNFELSPSTTYPYCQPSKFGHASSAFVQGRSSNQGIYPEKGPQ